MVTTGRVGCSDRFIESVARGALTRTGKRGDFGNAFVLSGAIDLRCTCVPGAARYLVDTRRCLKRSVLDETTT